MSGVKIDVDAVRERSAPTKAKIVVEDIDLASILAESSSKAKENLPPPANGTSSVKEIKEETIKEVLKNPEAKKSDAKVTVSDVKSPPKSEAKIVAPAAKSSAKSIAAEIKSAFRSAARSGVKGIVDVKPAQSSTIHVIDPIDSTQAKLDKEDEVREHYEEIDMMPRTDSEKHLYWKTKLQILKKSFPDVTIMKNIHELGWREIRKMYYIEMDRVSIGKNVDSYKLVMIVLFFIFELVGAKFLKINISGFTVHSIKSMHRYERLLMELGEKDYASFGENWPVEMRLAGMVMVNAIIFCIAKYIFKFTGQDHTEDFYEMFSAMGTQTVEDDIAPNAGLDAPAPGGKDGGGGGIGDILGSVLGGLGGGGGGGGLGGLGNLFSAFTGGGGGSKTSTAPKGDAKGEEGESRIRPPKYRKKKKKAKSDK